GLGVGEAEEPALVETLVAEAPVEAFDIAVLRRLAWLDELQLDPALVGPLVESPPGELRAVVRPYQHGLPAGLDQTCHDPHDVRAGEGKVCLQRQALPAVVIHHRQNPNYASVRQC